MSNPWHRLRPLTAAPLVVRRTMLWPLRRCALQVLNRGAQADAHPAVRVQASTVKKCAVRKISGTRQHPAAIADNARALG
jgi:hypothetical protein